MFSQEHSLIELYLMLYFYPQNLNKPSSSSNMLASISIPPNLTRILASLKETKDSNVKATSGLNAIGYNEEYNPEEDITANHSYGSGKCLRNSGSNIVY